MICSKVYPESCGGGGVASLSALCAQAPSAPLRRMKDELVAVGRNMWEASGCGFPFSVERSSKWL